MVPGLTERAVPLVGAGHDSQIPCDGSEVARVRRPPLLS